MSRQKAVLQRSKFVDIVYIVVKPLFFVLWFFYLRLRLSINPSAYTMRYFFVDFLTSIFTSPQICI
jgi:RsiW-degrading membrane proteinase PrsW (M82 family)